MRQPCTLIFDIGKTNKKLFLFDTHYNVLLDESVEFQEIEDDDGYLSDDLESIIGWIKNRTEEIISGSDYDVRAINFATYGASLVHIDRSGNRVTPFYNYLKPYPEELENEFSAKYKGTEFSLSTSSPSLGMLNSGKQLYFLKYQKPELFRKIHKSLHFPQYLSYLFTKQIVADYTSIGCHTGMWDCNRKKYAQWLEDEDLTNHLSPAIASSTKFPVEIYGRKLSVGIGAHDSSSALIPYQESFGEPFVLISTGTWNICLNPFTKETLTGTELMMDCLQFLDKEGNPVKASRLFLGKQHQESVDRLCEFYNTDSQLYKALVFNNNFNSKRQNQTNLLFDCSILEPERFGYTNNPYPDFSLFNDFEDAYLHLMDELTDLQIGSLKLSMGKSKIKDIVVEGGFSSNKVFLQILTKKLPEFNIFSSSAGAGAALGAALLVNDKNLSGSILDSQLELIKY